MFHKDNLRRLSYNIAGYKEIFGREPRKRTIEEIQDLWVRLLERNKPRREKRNKIIHEIVNKIPKNNSGEHVVYYNNDETYYKIVFRYLDQYKSYGFSRSRVDLDSRENILEYFTDEKIKFKLGEFFNESDNLISDFPYKIQEYLLDRINRELISKFKDKNPPPAFIISIKDTKYIVTTLENSKYDERKFCVECELGDKIINLS